MFKVFIIGTNGKEVEAATFKTKTTAITYAAGITSYFIGRGYNGIKTDIRKYR